VTRLADVTRPVGQAIFTPIVRPRIVQRVELAAAGRIILIVAPAGYGKSLALSHWLARQPRKHQRFDVQPEHNTLLGFARGLAEAFAPLLPALRKTVSTASQNSAASAAPGNEMARWMAAHLEAFDGIVVIDDFHRAGDDIEISRFVASLIARTKLRIQWIFATRSTLDLPVASWLAYGDAHFVIGDRDLTFREDEVRELAENAGGPLADPALREIMAATSGWPVALSLALRNSTIIQGANLANTTREVLFQYLAEQVYDQLSLVEREILQVASYLPSVELAVLEAAGYPDCARVLEAVRRRATFLSLESPGSYKCHDLFREFLKRQIEISDPPRAREIQALAAEALESFGNMVAALHLYSGLRATNEVLRILRLHGFDLIDHSHGDVVERAFRALPTEVRTTDAVILGLRAQREADAGHLDRAEALFRRAIRDPAPSEATATLSIRLAIILLNRGKPAAGVLEPLLQDASTAARAEVYGLLSADYSSKGSAVEAEAAISNAETLSSSVEDDAVTAKTSLRVAIAGLNVGLPLSRVRRAATAASELADRAGLPILAGRALTVLAAVSLCLENDIGKLVHYAALARTRAAQSGDVASLVTALLQLACAETQRGDEGKLKVLLEELTDVPDRPDSCDGMMQLLRATLFAWNGDLENAERSMDRFSRYGYSYYEFDRIADIALHSMYCAALGLRAKALLLVTEATRQIKIVNVPHPYAKSQRALATTFCGATHMLSDHTSVGRKILKNVLDVSESPPARIMSAAILSLREIPDRNEWKSTVAAHLEPLGHFQLGGLKKTVERCIEHYTATTMQEEPSEAALTRAELQVLRAIADGQSTKEIAALSDRSVHTVRTLIQRATSKLGCTSRYDAVRILQGTSGRE